MQNNNITIRQARLQGAKDYGSLPLKMAASAVSSRRIRPRCRQVK